MHRKGTKMINNRNIIGLNRMGRLKHRIEIFFGQSTKNFTEKMNYRYRMGRGKRCITLNRRRLVRGLAGGAFRGRQRYSF